MYFGDSPIWHVPSVAGQIALSEIRTAFKDLQSIIIIIIIIIIN
jgi:hypothetical protein